MSANSLQLYHNPYADFQYRYPRPYSTKLPDTGVTKSITSDGVAYKNVQVIGVPDGVSPLTNVTLIPGDVKRRLIVYSDSLLIDSELEVLDESYKSEEYPVLYFTVPVNVDASIPTSTNFIVVEDDLYQTAKSTVPSTMSRYTEYAYFSKRHQPANVLYDPTGGNLFRFVPDVRSRLVIVMPRNFIRTGMFTGYFLLSESNLIVRVYSRHVLSAEKNGFDPGVYSLISTNDLKQMTLFRSIFSKLGMHRISSLNPDQIYAHDAFMTIVVGNIANINLPMQSP